MDGNEFQPVAPAGDEIERIEHEGLVVVVINSQLAMRTWLVEDSLALGPMFGGSGVDE